MKKISKLIVFILMLVVSVASFVISPVLGIVLATGTAVIGASITLKKMPTSGSVNTPIYLPKGESNNGEDVQIIVTDPRGTDVELGSENFALETSGEHTGEYKLIPTMIGDYKVQYKTTETSTLASTTSKVYTIKVSGSKSTLTFSKNSPFMLPSSIGTETPIVLPYPSISETGNEEDAVEGNYDTVKVSIKDAKHNTLAEKTVTIDGKKYYVLSANKDVNENYIYGTYSIAYSYINTSGVKVTKTYTINVNANYTTENQNVTFTWEGSLPESAVLGEEVTLPTPVTVDKNSNNSSVLTYTKVSVELKNDNTVVKKYDVNQEKFTFTPMNEAKGSKYYNIVYKIYTIEKLDLYNYFNANSSTSFDEYLESLQPTITRTYDLKNVTDTVKPTVTAVNEYEIKTNQSNVNYVEDIDDEDIGYIIPNKARVGVEITLPAIYAEDNYDSYGSLTLTRGISYKSSETSTSDTTVWIENALNEEIKDKDGNPHITFSKVSCNKLSSITFHKAGTYKIIYQARDASGNINKDVVYKIVVPTEADYSDSVAPYIVLTGLPNSVRNGDSISFASPSVVDYAEDHNSNPTGTSTVDSNVKTDIYYYFGEYVAGKEPTAADCYKIEKDKDDNTLYKFNVNATTERKLTIVVRAEDDGKYTKNGLGADGSDINNVSYAHKTISIYGLDDDSVVPTLYNDTTALTSLANRLTNSGDGYAQGEVVDIFGETDIIKYSDLNDDSENKTGNLVSSLVVYDSNHKEINVTGFNYEYDGNYIILKGGKIVTTVAGTYQVVITTTDVAGNSVVNSVLFTVNDTKAPAIQVKNLKSTMELGTTYTLPTPIVVDDGKVIQNQSSMTVKFVGENPLYEFEHESLAFTPKKAGTYSFVYVASDGTNTIESDVYTITVADTIKPVIILNENEYQMPATANVGEDVILPSFTAEDENGIKSLTLTVTDSNGDKISPVDESGFTFNFEKDGKYKVVYTAVDLADNTTTEEYVIAVGDVVAPVIELDPSNKVINKKFKIGEKLTLNINGIKVTDDGEEYDVAEEADKSDGLVTITIKSPDGNVTQLKSTNDYSYEFTTAGTYTLTYSATDEAGNDMDPVSYTFEVEGNSNKSSVTEMVLGTVLIIASLALLAGVVIYFVKTKDGPADKLEKAKELANKKKEDK